MWVNGQSLEYCVKLTLTTFLNFQSMFICLQEKGPQMYSIEEIIHTPCYFFLHFAKDHLWNFPAVLNVKSDFLLINLWTSASSLGTLETLQCRSAVPNIKYNCAVLCLSEMYWLFMHVSKYFLIDGYCKTSVRNMCNSRLMFLQDDIP